MYSKPIIERFGIDIPMDSDRLHCADVIYRYLRNGDTSFKDEYYKCLKQLLNSRYYNRILLYIPFNDLADAPDNFKEAYINDWYRLLNYCDARENFHKGDVFEENARPNGEVDRVVKCIHLIPWLLKANYIGYKEIKSILNKNKKDEIVLRSIRDTLRFIEDYRLLGDKELAVLYKDTDSVKDVKRLKPLYISETRIKWLDECAGKTNREVIKGCRLDGQFSLNIIDEIKKIEKSLKDDEVVLVGGSRLKGYGTTDSDIDILRLDDLAKDQILRPGRLDAIHIYFNWVWVAGKSINTDRLSRRLAEKYFNFRNKDIELERLETDLIQYRLLHKGYSRVTGNRQFITNKYTEMDGDCPFYEDDYRKLATTLFTKYVYIPENLIA